MQRMFVCAAKESMMTIEDLKAHLVEQRAVYARAVELYEQGKLRSRDGRQDSSNVDRTNLEGIIANIDELLGRMG